MEVKMGTPKKFRPDPELKLMDQVVQVLRYHHYSYRTEKAYCDWIVRFLKYYDYKIHPKDMEKKEVEQFLSHLAVKVNVSTATQRQATSAILFLFREVLDNSMSDSFNHIRAQKKNPLPVVMTQDEIKILLSHLSGINLIFAKLLYGSGLRLMEAIRLRIKDLDFDNNQILVYDGKRDTNRITVFPKSIQHDLRLKIQNVKLIHDDDLKQGFGSVWLPDALNKKYPNASKEFQWQYVFPSKKRSQDPRSGLEKRHHILESSIQKAVKHALKKSDIHKRVSCHTFRHCFATHLLENGANIRQVQKLMGHKDLKTTEIYLHVMETKFDIESPLDLLT